MMIDEGYVAACERWIADANEMKSDEIIQIQAIETELEAGLKIANLNEKRLEILRNVQICRQRSIDAAISDLEKYKEDNK